LSNTLNADEHKQKRHSDNHECSHGNLLGKSLKNRDLR
jgi:hypothetical protein